MGREMRSILEREMSSSGERYASKGRTYRSERGGWKRTERHLASRLLYLEKRCRPHLKTTTDTWRVDETYIKIKGTWTYLYRAVDSEGNTLEFLLSPTRDAEAAKRFLIKALHSTACSAPGARPLEEQVEEPTALADPITTTSAPRVITLD